MLREVFFLLPELDDDSIAELYTMLYAQTYKNFWPTSYLDEEKKPPEIELMYYYDGLSLYGYYGAGTVNICIIPLVEDDLDIIAERHTELYAISKP